MDPIDIQVRYRNQAYHTSRVGKLAASSTSSAEYAALRLAEKIHGVGKVRVAQICAEVAGLSRWRIHLEAA
jgi:hypothetical protein